MHIQLMYTVTHIHNTHIEHTCINTCEHTHTHTPPHIHTCVRTCMSSMVTRPVFTETWWILKAHCLPLPLYTAGSHPVTLQKGNTASSRCGMASSVCVGILFLWISKIHCSEALLESKGDTEWTVRASSPALAPQGPDCFPHFVVKVTLGLLVVSNYAPLASCWFKRTLERWQFQRPMPFTGADTDAIHAAPRPFLAQPQRTLFSQHIQAELCLLRSCTWMPSRGSWH